MSTRILLPKPKKAAPKLRTVNLREQAGGITPVFTSPLKVDEEAGIIYRVKILGWESRNGRRYLPEAVQKKLHLYDGAKAFVNHPRKATDPRDGEDALGVWRNPVLESDGAYADLHYFKSHPFTARVVEDAKRGLGVFGASHNADGQGQEDATGDFVVRDLIEVRSVDLVTDAATVTNLWESRKMQTTLRQLIEADAGRKQFFKQLLEMPEDEMPALDMPMEPPAADVTAEDGDALLAKAIAAYVASGSAPNHEKATKLLKLMKPESAETSRETTTEEEEDDSEKKKDDEDKPKETAESRKQKQAPGVVTLTEEKAKRLCKLANIPADAELLEALKGLTEEKAMSLLEWQQRKAAPPQRNGVRSQGPIGHRPDNPDKVGAKTDEEFEKRILSRA